MDQVSTAHIIELVTATLIFIAALVPLAQIGWAKYSSSQNQPQIIKSVLSWLSVLLYIICFVIWFATTSYQWAISIYMVGWLLQAISFVLEEEKVKGAIVSLIVCSVVLSTLIQGSLLHGIIDIQRSIIETQSEILEYLESQSSAAP